MVSVYSVCASVALLLCVYSSNAQSIDAWYDRFEYNTFVDSDEMFQVFWTPNEAACTVEFGLAVETDSYAALGISESGGMGGSDIVMGWITDDGEYILQNRYATARALPSLMNSQSGIRKIDGWKEEVNGTVMTFIHFEKGGSRVHDPTASASAALDPAPRVRGSRVHDPTASVSASAALDPAPRVRGCRVHDPT